VEVVETSKGGFGGEARCKQVKKRVESPEEGGACVITSADSDCHREEGARWMRSVSCLSASFALETATIFVFTLSTHALPFRLFLVV
jgi:hypothetical protein